MSRPAVLFIHGMWGTPKVWASFMPHFEAAGHVTDAVTLRHHTTLITEPPPEGLGTTSILDYVDDVVKTVNALETAPVLIGHSMGGLVAQMVAARTDNVKAVIALTPAPPSGVFALKPSTLKLFRKILLTPGFWKKPVRLTWEAAHRGVYDGLSETKAREQFVGNVWDSGRAVFEIGFWLMDRSGATKLDENRVKCPVLIVAGAKDLTVNASVVKAAAKRYKGRADYKEFADQSHWLLSAKGWEDVADYCLDWIAKTTV